MQAPTGLFSTLGPFTFGSTSNLLYETARSNASILFYFLSTQATFCTGVYGILGYGMARVIVLGVLFSAWQTTTHQWF